MGNSVRLTVPLLLPGGRVAPATVPTAGGCPPSKSRNLMSAMGVFADSAMQLPQICLYDWEFRQPSLWGRHARRRRYRLPRLGVRVSLPSFTVR